MGFFSMQGLKLNLRLLLLGMCLTVLAACAEPTKVIPCPPILIPLDTERVTRFAPGSGRDITDVVMRGEIRFLSGECTVKDEEVEMTFPIAVRGLRGPAQKTGVEPIRLFLAVSTPDRQILNRREMDMTLNFEGNRTTTVSADTVTVVIPKKEEQSARSFILFIGLVLSEEELQYNREESRR